MHKKGNKYKEELGETVELMRSLLLPKEEHPFQRTAWHPDGWLTRRCDATDDRRSPRRDLFYPNDGSCCSHTSAAGRNLQIAITEA